MADSFNFSAEFFWALIGFFAPLLILRAYLWNMGRLWFWNVVFSHSDLFFAHMDKDDAWIYSSVDLPKPSDEFAGPFYLNKDGKKNKIYALKQELNRSQDDFIAENPTLFGPTPFPVISGFFLLYPVLAMLSVPDMNVLLVMGYGFTNLGYLLAISGVIAGTFKALGLIYRVQVLIVAILSFVAGLLLWNA